MTINTQPLVIMGIITLIFFMIVREIERWKTKRNNLPKYDNPEQEAAYRRRKAELAAEQEADWQKELDQRPFDPFRKNIKTKW